MIEVNKTNRLIETLLNEERADDAYALDVETQEVSLRVNKMILELEAVL